MKKLSLVLLVTLFTMTQQSVFAQSFTEWNWATYSLKFSAPSDFKVETSTADEFSAKLSNDLLHLTITPWKDASLTKETLKQSIRELCKEIGFTAREIGTINDLDLNGFEGCYVMVTQDGATMIVEGLLDPESETNFYAIIMYGERYETKALQIANSFTK